MNKCFQQAIKVLKKVGSHGDYQGVLLACWDEQTGYHSLSLKQVSQ